MTPGLEEILFSNIVSPGGLETGIIDTEQGFRVFILQRFDDITVKMERKSERNLGEDIEALRAMVKHYGELPDATIHLLRGLDEGLESLEHRWEVTHEWVRYPVEEGD